MENTGCCVVGPLVGSAAPDFKGMAYQKDFEGDYKEVSLADYKGKWLVLFFYPLAFSGPCSTEIGAFNEALDEFAGRKAEVLGCSTDSHFTLKAWMEKDFGDVKFPLLADMTKAISANYRVLTEQGFALRGLFIIDPEGNIAYNVVHTAHIGRSVDETLRVLDALQTGGFCPANWKKGDKTL